MSFEILPLNAQLNIFSFFQNAKDLYNMALVSRGYYSTITAAHGDVDIFLWHQLLLQDFYFSVAEIKCLCETGKFSSYHSLYLYCANYKDLNCYQLEAVSSYNKEKYKITQQHMQGRDWFNTKHHCQMFKYMLGKGYDFAYIMPLMHKMSPFISMLSDLYCHYDEKKYFDHILDDKKSIENLPILTLYSFSHYSMKLYLGSTHPEITLQALVERKLHCLSANDKDRRSHNTDFLAFLLKKSPTFSLDQALKYEAELNPAQKTAILYFVAKYSSEMQYSTEGLIELMLKQPWFDNMALIKYLIIGYKCQEKKDLAYLLELLECLAIFIESKDTADYVQYHEYSAKEQQPVITLLNIIEKLKNSGLVVDFFAYSPNLTITHLETFDYLLTKGLSKENALRQISGLTSQQMRLIKRFGWSRNVVVDLFKLESRYISSAEEILAGLITSCSESEKSVIFLFLRDSAHRKILVEIIEHCHDKEIALIALQSLRPCFADKLTESYIDSLARLLVSSNSKTRSVVQYFLQNILYKQILVQVIRSCHEFNDSRRESFITTKLFKLQRLSDCELMQQYLTTEESPSRDSILTLRENDPATWDVWHTCAII
jgi:hypothetical protein